MKILLAEDDTTSAEYVQKGLAGQGFLVDWVTDGRKALAHGLYNEVDHTCDRMSCAGEPSLASVSQVNRCALSTKPMISSFSVAAKIPKDIRRAVVCVTGEMVLFVT